MFIFQIKLPQNHTHLPSKKISKNSFKEKCFCTYLLVLVLVLVLYFPQIRHLIEEHDLSCAEDAGDNSDGVAE